MKCPMTTEAGGPVISLEVTEMPDTMAIVWMSISTDFAPISGYRLYLNSQQCGDKVSHSNKNSRGLQGPVAPT